MKVRRVVTGHTPDGESTVASDTEVDAITLDLMPGAEFHRLLRIPGEPGHVFRLNLDTHSG